MEDNPNGAQGAKNSTTGPPNKEPPSSTIKAFESLLKIESPLLKSILPNISRSQTISGNMELCHLIFYFIATIVVLVAVTGLAYYGIIDGGAAVAIYGGIIGYIFANPNNQ